jgi:hypothetical protein
MGGGRVLAMVHHRPSSTDHPETEHAGTDLAVDPLALVRRHGIVVESGVRFRPVFTGEIVGELIRGSWWGHRRAHAIFAATRIVRRQKKCSSADSYSEKSPTLGAPLGK